MTDAPLSLRARYASLQAWVDSAMKIHNELAAYLPHPHYEAQRQMISRVILYPAFNAMEDIAEELTGVRVAW